MKIEDIYLISIYNFENYPFIIGNLYEFKFGDKCIFLMFHGESRINKDYLFYTGYDNLYNDLRYFSYLNCIFCNDYDICHHLIDNIMGSIDRERFERKYKNERMGFISKCEIKKINDIINNGETQL
tara:strand:- start:71877 stop:72254 length:378 start_codon:yes stop_codon:yes gene_type:complete